MWATAPSSDALARPCDAATMPSNSRAAIDIAMGRKALGLLIKVGNESGHGFITAHTHRVIQGDEGSEPGGYGGPKPSARLRLPVIVHREKSTVRNQTRPASTDNHEPAYEFVRFPEVLVYAYDTQNRILKYSMWAALRYSNSAVARRIRDSENQDAEYDRDDQQ